MKSDTKVTVYYGPPSWFEEQLGKGQRQYLLDLLNERDEARRRIRHTIDGQESTDKEACTSRSECAIAMSSDYASVHEHAITAWACLVATYTASSPRALMLLVEPITVSVERICCCAILCHAHCTNGNEPAKFTSAMGRASG